MCDHKGEVLRRVQDLLAGDVVAHNGRRRKVERVFADRLAMAMGRDITCVVFEDCAMLESRGGQFVKRGERFGTDTRLLLLESHYTA